MVRLGVVNDGFALAGSNSPVATGPTSTGQTGTEYTAAADNTSGGAEPTPTEGAGVKLRVGFVVYVGLIVGLVL